MARIVHNQTNFTAGELTPRMKGRGDVARYQNGAEVIENGVVVVHGGVKRRDGLRFLAKAKWGHRTARMIRYVYSVEQSYALEFGHRYVRFFDASTGATLLDDAMAVLEIESPYTEGHLPAITTKQLSDVMYLFHPLLQPYQLRRLSATKWTLTPVTFAVQPFAELGHQPDAQLSLSLATVGAGRTFTTTPTTAPGAPVIGTAFARNGGATVNYSAPASNGGLPITEYTATSSPGGITGTSTGTQIIVSGLTNGVSYTFTVTATNGAGTSAPSAASNAVVPSTSAPSSSIVAISTPSSFSKAVNNGLVLNIAGPTASSTGGFAPYSYSWKKIGGSSAIVITQANTAQVRFKSTAYGATNYATFRCVVTDGLGSTGTVDVAIAILHQTRDPRLEAPPGGDIP